MAAGDVWTVNKCKAYIDNTADVTIGTAVSVQSLVSSATSIEVQLKNIKIQSPNTKPSQIGTLGVDTRGYRNAHKGYERSDMASIKGDMVFIKGQGNLAFLAADSTATVAATGYTRVVRGSATPKDVSLIMAIDDDSDSVYVLLNKATLTLGEIDIDDGETHAKCSFEAMCLPTDYYEDWED